jgi:hypothetical protein
MAFFFSGRLNLRVVIPRAFSIFIVRYEASITSHLQLLRGKTAFSEISIFDTTSYHRRAKTVDGFWQKPNNRLASKVRGFEP